MLLLLDGAVDNDDEGDARMLQENFSGVLFIFNFNSGGDDSFFSSINLRCCSGFLLVVVVAAAAAPAVVFVEEIDGIEFAAV